LGLRYVTPWNKENEFVSSDSGEFGTSANPITKTRSEDLDYFVAAQMAERFIDVFEAINVDPDSGERFAVGHRIGGKRFCDLQTAKSIQKSGECVYAIHVAGIRGQSMN
jgi:hypothetical protein